MEVSSPKLKKRLYLRRELSKLETKRKKKHSEKNYYISGNGAF